MAAILLEKLLNHRGKRITGKISRKVYVTTYCDRGWHAFKICFETRHHLTCDTWHLTHDTWPLTCDTWHVTCDMWHLRHDKLPLTFDTWHMTHNIWHVTHGGGWTFSQNFSSLALTVWDLWCLEDWEEKDDSMKEWMNESVTEVFVGQPRLHRVC